MNKSSRKSLNIFVRIKNAAILLAVCAVFAGSTSAQAQAPAVAATSTTVVTAAPATAVAKGAGTNDKTAATGTDLKASLATLSTLYQNEIQRLEKQNAKLKELYTQGLLSHVEMEKSDKELADARAKLEDVAKQTAELNKPAATPLLAMNEPGSNQAWSTGN